MVVQIPRICFIKHDKRRCYADSRLLIKEIRKDFNIHSPFSIFHSQFIIGASRRRVNPKIYISEY